MEKIKVYLQYPWKFPDSPYYKYLLQNPPIEVKYFVDKEQKGVITNKNFFWSSNFLKRFLRKIVNIIKIPILNKHKLPLDKKYDLIHCAHCLGDNSRPWVADFESMWQLWVNGSDGQTKEGVKKARKSLIHPNCKKIITWTNRTKEEFIRTFPEIKDKVITIYPGVPIPRTRINRKNKREINLSFVSRYFFEKGGLDTLRVFDYLSKKYDNVNCFVVGSIEPSIRKRYSKNKKIKFLDLIPQERLYEEVYSKTDILVYPGYSDTFGFAIVEAMSFGIPVVSVEGKSRREIIIDGKNGYVIPLDKDYHWKELEFTEKETIIEEVIKKTEHLILNPSLRTRMGEESIKEIKEGKFSVKTRNKSFFKIYKEVLKK